MDLVLSFPIGILPEISQNELYKQLYREITQVVNEDDVKGVQIYPAQWPRKVLISVKDNTIKQALLIAGLNINGVPIELTDESSEVMKITMKDAMIEWDDPKIINILSPFGNVLKVESEKIYIDGKVTKWKTGTRFIYMTKIDHVIPNRLTTLHGDKEVTVSIWYKRPQETREKCYKCGGMHRVNACSFDKKVCYICQGDHEIKECPQNDGSRSNEHVFCFMTERSPLSNFNMKYPIQLNGVQYNGNEQYIQSRKAELFGDHEAVQKIMASNDPREMKNIGKRIKGYVDAEWKQHSCDVIAECVRAKVYSYKEVQDYLLSTGDKLIGEGTPDPHFGVGIHIKDSRVLNPEEWTGNNIMGRALVDIRSEIKLIHELRNNSSDDHSPANPITGDTSTPERTSNQILDIEEMAISPVPIHHENTTDSQIAPTSPTTHKNCAVLLGDSNAKGIHVNSTDVEVTKICRSAATLQDVSELMDECTKRPEEVRAVLIQLGAYNWSCSPTDDIEKHESLYREFIEMLNSVSSRYPQAELVISSIPQRMQSDSDQVHIDAINNEITALNASLQALAKEEENVVFINNELDLTVNGLPNALLYVESDKTGVHLNEAGLALVSHNVSEWLNAYCTKNSKNGEWKISS